ncbi:50S ribosomal protein L5 [Halobacteriovorax marinus]|uniref:Large ribosomal subunit protein uL5 n=1 Tax=Halobacteriovorax marinus (strain ATCC BAA-682 / DSM 15412 / SJ) TaxID=862908 RepID=E1X0L0_HALMS|nr:50S ribosomal protein L5 [Halobacteriovorax marinus]ATH09296.1 50S ribosomal protein L5 [Halobacteriovorax marinus]CBW28036.1 50S ribosomal protein L5 [Halobacteriovorax marinus SJ]
MSRLQKTYKNEVVGKLRDKYQYKNIHQVPKLEKIVVNCCTKDAVTNSKVVDSIIKDLTAIAGQKPVVATAKKSIASFKVREGMPLGASVTLRGERMYDFLDRLITISLPRVRDFRGVSKKGFDGRGNYTLGLKEQIMFSEITYDQIDKVRGLGVSIVTTATNNDEGRELLTLLGMPFAK